MIELIELVGITLYALLPAYGANMAPVIAARLNFLPYLAIPVDGEQKLWGARVFGDHKTYRGVVIGVLTAMFVGVIQYFLWIFRVIQVNSFIDFAHIDPLMFGFIGGAGALGGDLLKSFAKRRFKIPSGSPWPVFDQLDFIIGYIATTSLIVPWPTRIIIVACVMTLIAHPLTNIAAYILKIKKVWW